MRKTIGRLTLAMVAALTATSGTAQAANAGPGCGDLAGIYLQGHAMTEAYRSGQLGQLISQRGLDKPIEVEMGLQNAMSFKKWKVVWDSIGIAPEQDNVIIDYPVFKSWFKAFQEYVLNGRAVGLRIIAPIFSPNIRMFPLDSFSDNKAYDEIRQAALLGGGLVLDSPPNFFFRRGAAYQNFAYQQVKWARQHGLRSTVIISPFGDNGHFLQNVKKYVSMYAEHDALPSEWAIENYNSSINNGSSCEGSVNSVAGVADWLSKNARTDDVHWTRQAWSRTHLAQPTAMVFQGIPGHL